MLQIEEEKKLYLVTHAELSVSYQLAQIAHVIAEWSIHKPLEAQEWHTTNNTLVILEARTYEEILFYKEKAEKRFIETFEFREPDIGNLITAIAFSPHHENRKLFANLPLAGKIRENSFVTQQKLKDQEKSLTIYHRNK